jgi:23S rRNA (cytosine1962-C5)-methyltransferase
MKVQATVHLKRDKEHSILRKHPWIFSGAIHNLEGSPADGDWVRVQSAAGQTLGHGQYQKGSIAVRILSFDATPPNEKFYEEKLRDAYELRTSAHVLNERTNACRIVHGEGDGLPSLIVDLYNKTAVLQAHSHGMHKDRTLVAAALKQVIPGLESVFYKAQSTLNDSQPEYLVGGPPERQVITENGNQFHVDWQDGQKTGFFVDQRDNRALVGNYSSGRNVLNAFCYTGGFSVYALKGGARLVHSVDVSARAIEMTASNLELNNFDPSQHECFAQDTFDFMKDKQDRYDMIVLDPPAFAKHKDSKHQAMKGYKRLNAEAMKVIRSGGIIFTFSCSQVVDRQLFYDTVVSAAIVAGREIKVLQHLGQPADHPVSIYHREGEYLKGLVLHVG